MSDLAQNLIAEEEGRDPCAYPDTEGFFTIGIGALVDRRKPGAGLCDAAIDAQFAHDSAEAWAIAARFPHYSELNDVRQAVLISMAFQLGTKPLHWSHFMASLEARDYVKAAVAGRDSDWWRVQTHARAERAMRMLESSKWVDRI